MASRLYQLGISLTELGRHAEAEPLLREALRYVRARNPRDPSRLLWLMAYHAAWLERLDRHEEALPLCREFRELARDQETPEALWTASALACLGLCLNELGKHAEAEPLLVWAYEKMGPSSEAEYWRSKALERIVALYEAWEKPEKAAEWYTADSQPCFIRCQARISPPQSWLRNSRQGRTSIPS